MRHHQPRWEDLFLTRRDFLCRGGMGMGALALAGVMGDAFGDAPRPASGHDVPPVPRQPHFAAKAKRVIHLFLSGGPSHVDTFDHKPALDKHHGQELPKSIHLVTERRTGTVMRSPFASRSRRSWMTSSASRRRRYSSSTAGKPPSACS